MVERSGCAGATEVGLSDVGCVGSGQLGVPLTDDDSEALESVADALIHAGS